MKKFLGAILFCLAATIASAQFVYTIKGDSILLTNDSCNTELILQNSTKNVCGFLFNKGNGRTEFRSPLITINDSTYLIGCDTLKLHGGTNISADNGLTDSSGRIILGGALYKNTTIDDAGSTLTITNGPQTSLIVTNTGSAEAINASAIAGAAVHGSSTNGYGLWGFSTNAPGGILNINPSSTNTVAPILDLVRNTSGTAANGIGMAIQFSIETNTGAGLSNQIISMWTNATNSTRTSQMLITGVSNALTNNLVAIDGTGVLGIGNFSSFNSTRLDVVDNNVAGASIANISSTSTGAASNLQKALNISLSGANSNNNQTTYGIYVSNSHTGTGAVNYGVYSNAGSGIAIYGTSTNLFAIDGQSTNSIGVLGSSTNNNGVQGNASSSSGYGGYFTTTTSSTNTIEKSLGVQRSSTGTSAAGLGTSIDFMLQANVTGNLSRQANTLVSKWTDATDATRTSQFYITGVNSATSQTLQTLDGNGQLTLNQYTTSNFNGGSANDSVLVVTSTGVVKKRNASLVGGGSSSQTLQQTFNTEVGGSVLTKLDTIQGGTFGLKLFGSNSNSGGVFQVVDNSLAAASTMVNLSSASTNAATLLKLTASTNMNAVSISGTTATALSITTTSGTGVGVTTSAGQAGNFNGSAVGVGGTSTGIPMWAISQNASTNTAVQGLVFSKVNTAGAAGLGVRIQTDLANASSGQKTASNIYTQWQTATAASENAQYFIDLLNTPLNASADHKMVVDGTGVVGIGQFASFGATRLHVTDNTMSGSFPAVRIQSSSNVSGQLLNVVATGSSMQGVYAQTVDNAALIGSASGSGVGLSAVSSTGTGGIIQANSSSATGLVTSGGLAAQMSAFNSSTGGSIPIMIIQRSAGAGNPATNGTGGSILFKVTTDDATHVLQTNEIISKWTTAADATRTSQMLITGVNSAAIQTLQTLDGNGQLTLNQYTATNFNGGTANDSVLVVTSAGVVKKRNAALVSGFDGKISSLSAASQNNTIDNSNLIQEWQWNTLAGTSGLKLSSTSTAAASNAQKLLEISLSGANTTGSQTTYSLDVANSHSGSSPTNIGARFQATGATNNYAIIVPASSGNVGIGTSTPSSSRILDVVASGSTTGVAGTSSSGVGVIGNSSTGIGMSALSTSGTGLNAASTSSIAAFFSTNPSSTNTVAEVVQVSRSSSGTPANGIGASVGFYPATSTSVITNVSNQLISKWTDATNATRTSEFSITGVNSASTVTVLKLGSTGYMQLQSITATSASAITPSAGMIVFVNSTNGTFTSVGFWGYNGTSWAKF